MPQLETGTISGNQALPEALDKGCLRRSIHRASA